MAKNEVKYGAILSYALIFINTIYGLIITPYILSTIGTSEYGVYKTIGSMTASLSVLELGIGGTMQRYIAKFNALGQKKEASNFSAMGLMQAAVLAVVMLGVGICLFFSIEGVYSSTFSSFELKRAKQIFVFQLLYVVFHIFENVLFGVISGYNKFIFTNSVKFCTIIIKVILYFIVLPIFKNSLTIVIISFLLEIFIILFELIFIKFSLKHKIHFYIKILYYLIIIFIYFYL